MTATITMMRLRQAVALMALGVWAMAGGGCSSDEPEEPPETMEADEGGDDDEGDEVEKERISEAFGLPVPPDHYNVRQRNGRIEVRSDKSLEEIREFFESRVVDYEVVDEGWRFELVPLRSDAPSAVARYAAERGSAVRVQYRHAKDAVGSKDVEAPPQAQDSDMEATADEDRPRPTDPEWMEEHRGEPVELTTEDGQLLAPGARWGEPYIPPEGSPLDTELNTPNFGRPFGEWSGM